MQRVVTPRIYVDYLGWLSALGFNVKPWNIGVGFNVDKIYSIQSEYGNQYICSFGQYPEGNYALFPKQLKINCFTKNKDENESKTEVNNIKTDYSERF